MNDDLRIFNLQDFPSNYLYVKLDAYFVSRFCLDLLTLCLSGKFPELKKSWLSKIEYWNQKLNIKISEAFFIPLDSVLFLYNFLKEQRINWYAGNELEKSVLAIKGYRASKTLYNPRLPIQENQYLVRIIVHLIGDGYLPDAYGEPRTPNYTNGNEFLLDQFQECLSQVFGDISECSRKRIDKTGNSRSAIVFSKWIGYIIQTIYPDAKFDHVNGSLPNAFFNLSFDLKAEIVRTFGDDDGHVGAHSIRFTSGGPTILEQMRRLIVELMEATLPSEEFKALVKSVGAVKAFRSWYILDVYRPLFQWYSDNIGFSHPERAERLRFQLVCDRVWGERGLDGFDLDFLTLVGLREVGSVADIARLFMVREDFLFEVFQRLRKLGWIERVEKRKFTTFFQTTHVGEIFLERTLGRVWSEKDRVVLRNEWWLQLRDGLLKRFGTAAEVARVVEMPETTVRGYLQGRRQWMHAKWVVALAEAVGWGQDGVSEGVVVAFSTKLAPRYEQCDFLGKDLGVYRRFSLGEISFVDWLESRRVEAVREERLLDAEFAKKLQSARVIRERIVGLAMGGGGEVTLERLKADPVLRGLVVDRYGAYLADRMAKLVKQGVFVRVRRGYYRVVDGDVR